MKISEIAIKNPVGTILLALAAVLLGIFAIPGIPVSFWPEFVAPSLVVITPYPNVGPLEIEEQIAKPLEEQLATIDGLDELETTCMDGICRVIARFKWGVDFDEAKNKVQEQTFKARSRFPREALEPVVLQVQDFLPPGIQLGFNSKQRSLNEIRDLVEDKIKNRLLRLENVAQVQISGGFEQEIAASVDADRLSRYGITLAQINASLLAENMNVPAGKISSLRNDYFIRTMGKYNDVEEIANTIISVLNGVPIRLRDVADVQLQNKERSAITRLNGVEIVSVSVREKSGGNTVAMCEEVKKEIPLLKAALPADVQITIISDQSVFIRNAIRSVINNALLGALLAAMIIYLFLGNLRNTLIIALSIPISIIATFSLIKFFGLSINTISLGGLAMGVGMIVDASVVVIENIFRHLKEKPQQDRLTTVVEATREVGMAITSSTLTSVVVFLPLAFLVGLFAVLLGELALTVVFALSISIIVSLTLVPMLSFKYLRIHTSRSPLAFLVKSWQSLFEIITELYRATMRWALRHRLLTVFLAFTLLAIILRFIVPLLDVELLPSTNEGEFRIEWTMAEGTRLEATDRNVAELERDIQQMPEVEQVYVDVGRTAALGEAKPNIAVIDVRLNKNHRKEILRVMERVRQRWRDVPGSRLLVKQVTATEGMQRPPIDVRIIGNDLQTLETIGQQIYATIAQVPGIVNLSSSIQENVAEFGIHVDRTKAADLGLTSSQVARSIREAVLGSTPTRLSLSGTEYDISVKLDSSHIQTISDLLNLPLITPRGQVIPLRALAHVELQRSPSEIKRTDQQRLVEIKADVSGRPMRVVQAEVQQQLKKIDLPVDYRITFGGQSRAIADSFRSLMIALAIAIFLVYVVMGAQFNSFLHPFTITLTIPLALIGAVLGLLIFSAALSMNALLGMIVLVGVVVNNGILLIDYISQLRIRGQAKDVAIINGGATRLRPIFITSLTTIFGMLPIALGLGEGGEALAPLGAVVLGGLTTSTFLTLVVIPCVYSIFESIKRKK